MNAVSNQIKIQMGAIKSGTIIISQNPKENDFVTKWKDYQVVESQGSSLSPLKGVQDATLSPNNQATTDLETEAKGWVAGASVQDLQVGGQGVAEAMVSGDLIV